MTIKKIVAIIPRLGSDHDGEIVAAAKAIGRKLAVAKCGFVDLANALSSQAPIASARTSRRASPAPRWKNVAIQCAQYGVGILSERELQFVDSLVRLKSCRNLSEKQASWLTAIHEKLMMKQRGAA